MLRRRAFLGQLAGLLTLSSLNAHAESAPLVQVYKSRTCGCCSKWADHLRDAGFDVATTDVRDVNLYKLEYAVPPQLASCHTAIVEGYVVEGHVPADDIIKLLRTSPPVTGIAVPGMPIGSPGPEGPNPERYETLAFIAGESVEVFAVHEPA